MPSVVEERFRRYDARMDWSPAVLGFLGALIGALAPAFLQARATQRTRLEDAYAELAGASSLLLIVSIESMFGGSSSDGAWVRFGAARARVLLQENDLDCRAKVAELAAGFEDLYTTTIRLDEDSTSKEVVAREQLEHLAKMKGIEERLNELLGVARLRLSEAK